MLIDSYPKEAIFARVPKMTERIDPVLQQLDRLLDNDEVYQQVRNDFGKRYRSTLVHGRHSTPVEVLLRMLLLKHLYGWSFQETEDRVDESLVLRWFCRLFWEPTPDDTTLIRWANTLQPETLHQLNDRVVELARQARVTQGRKLRLDATCVQTEIHHPTDSGLLVDSVRVLSRFVKRAKGLVAEQVRSVEQTCRSRLRSAKRVAQQLHRQLRRKSEDKEAQQKERYQKLVETAEHMVRQATRVVQALGQQSEQQAKRLRSEAEAVLPLVKQVIAQTRSRVLEGKKVPSDQKVLSLFEPHTRAIPRHKGGALVEFGRHVILDEIEGGIVTRYEILEHPNEHGQAVEAVAHHIALFDHPPGTVAGDRGVHSPQTEVTLTEAGVKRVAIPVSGKLSEERKALEHTRPWKTLLANERNCAIDQDAPQRRSVSGGNDIKGPYPTMIRTPAQASWSIVGAIPCGRPVRTVAAFALIVSFANRVLEARVSLACGHRGPDREPETRLRLAQMPLSRARRDGAVVGSGGHRQ